MHHDGPESPAAVAEQGPCNKPPSDVSGIYEHYAPVYYNRFVITYTSGIYGNGIICRRASWTPAISERGADPLIIVYKPYVLLL